MFGGIPLHGLVDIQGSKNAALPILAATLLISGTSVIHNCPKITDIFSMIKILESVGCRVVWQDHTLIVDAATVRIMNLPKEHVAVMRSSIILMGAMLGRCGQIVLDYPGGCVIGDRPVDIHLKSLTKMNILITEEEYRVSAYTTGIIGTDISLAFPSVGATENLILAAVCASGTTRIFKAAKEPEIEELCIFLNKAGAQILGAGSDCIVIEGVEKLHETEHTVVSDRIAAGTYALSALATKGSVTLHHVKTSHLGALLCMIKRMGASVQTGNDYMKVSASGSLKAIPYVKTEIYPGFPTDLQSQLSVALSMAEGESIIEETIFENRFRLVDELLRMEANIEKDGNRIKVKGVKTLYGKRVCAEELRGGAALVMAGLAAEGVTDIFNRHFIERGYEDICRDFKMLGAQLDIR